MNMLWFLLRCTTTAQNRFVQRVQDRYPQIQIYIPQYPRISRPHGLRRTISIPTPVYPGYIFAHLNPEEISLHSLILTPPRAYYIRFNGKIAIVPDQVILQLKEKEDKNLLMTEKTIVDPYKPGKRVIVHLPIADIQAIIIKCIGANHVILDTPLGRATVPKTRVSVAGT